jgi:hypothetical protein
MRWIIFVLLLFGLFFQSYGKDKLEKNTYSFERAANGEVNLGTELWAAGGAGLANSSNPEALLYNPAWRSSQKQLVIGGGGFRLGMDCGYSFADPMAPVQVSIASRFVFPGYLMGVSRYRSLLFQGGYRQLYNTAYRFKQDYILNNVAYKETVYENTVVNDFFVGLNFAPNNRLSVGAQVGFALLQSSLRGEEDSLATATGVGLHVRLGLIHHLGRTAALAFTYDRLSTITYQYSTEGESPFTPGSYSYSIHFPEYYTLAFSLFPGGHTIVSFRLRYEHPSYAKEKDRMQLGGGIRFGIGSKATVGLGAFTLGALPGNDHFEDVIFLTAGFTWQMLPILRLSFSVLTSHFTSDLSDRTQQLDQTRLLTGMQLRLGE